jgi:YjbE family integral membrane protein
MDNFGPEFWVALMQIIGVNIVLSGDNAVVIALAARSLPPEQQKKAVAWGSGAAVVMRIVLTVVAVKLLALPYLKLVGAVLLLWIALQLLLPEDEHEGEAKASGNLAAAIKTILIADLVMSLDNVIAVAAAAKGSMVLLIAGLAISIPLVVFASTLLLTLMGRFPIIITIGAALLGWVAGEMAISDPAVKDWVDASMPFLHWLAPALGAAGVVLVGKFLGSRRAHESAEKAVAAEPVGAPASTGQARWLLPVDGSESSLRAVRKAIELALATAVRPQLHVLNVQAPLPGDPSAFLEPGAQAGLHREQSDAAVAGARAALVQAGLAYELHAMVGEPSEVITTLAAKLGCEQIVLGAHGIGASAALRGSVAKRSAELAGGVKVVVID